MDDSVAGSVPSNMLSEMDNHLMEEIRPNASGRVPVSRFWESRNVLSLVSCAIASGKGVVMPLLDKSSATTRPFSHSCSGRVSAHQH